MHEVGERLLDEAIAVMNRALEQGAKAEQLIPGSADEGGVSIAVLGSNPDEDQGVTLRVQGGRFQRVERFDPHRRGEPAAFRIRLDDLKRIASDPEHYASAPSEVARLMTAS